MTMISYSANRRCVPRWSNRGVFPLEIVRGPDLRPRYGSGRIVCTEQTDRDGTGNPRNGTQPSVRPPKWADFPPYRPRVSKNTMKCVVVRGRLSGSGRPEPADSADRIPERGSVPFRSGSVPALQVRERSLIFEGRNRSRKIIT